jgi:hypothetical protein
VLEALNLLGQQLSQLHLVTFLFESGLLDFERVNLLIVQRDLVPVVVLPRLNELHIARWCAEASLNVVDCLVRAMHDSLSQRILSLIPIVRAHGREAEFELI